MVTLSTALVVVLAACGSSSNKSSDVTAKGSTDTTAAASGVDYSNLSGTLNGSGSTFQAAFEETAIAGFQEPAPGVTVNYAGGGSGKGKQDLADQVVDFAGTDSLAKPETLSTFKGGALLYFPIASAPITVSFNLPGVDKLQLSPETLAKIFARTITKWNDPAIAAENSGAELPADDIVVAHRADGSGTTNNFTKYLAAAAPAEWTLGSGDTVNWDPNTQAGTGNPGVADIVKTTDNAIGYVDFADAKAAGLALASIKNSVGQVRRAQPGLGGQGGRECRDRPRSHVQPAERARRGRVPDHVADLDPRVPKPDRQGKGRGAEGVPELRAHRRAGRRQGRRLRQAARVLAEAGDRAARQDPTARLSRRRSVPCAP